MLFPKFAILLISSTKSFKGVSVWGAKKPHRNVRLFGLLPKAPAKRRKLNLIQDPPIC